MSGPAAEHTEIIVETALAFLRGELSVFSEFVGKCGGISGGSRLTRVVVGVLIVLVLVGITGVVVIGVRFAGFLIGLVFVGLVLIRFVFLGAGLLAETFVVPGVDGVCESLHSFESGRFTLLAHDVHCETHGACFSPI